MSRVDGHKPAKIKPLTDNTRGGWFYVVNGNVEVCLEDHDGNVLQGRIPVAMIQRRAKGEQK